MRYLIIFFFFYHIGAFASWNKIQENLENAFNYKVSKKVDFGKELYLNKGDKEFLFEVYYWGKNFSLIKKCVFLSNIEDYRLSIFSQEVKKECTWKEEALKSPALFNLSMNQIGEKLFLYIDKEKIEIQKNNKYLLGMGKQLGDSLEDNQLCYHIDDDCKELLPNICEACKAGSYKVINSSCPRKVSRKCGAVPCGQKGTPACIRGWYTTDYKLDYCINDSPIAYCKKPLRVICLNGELLCQ